jgi:hypothetical protein
MFWVYANFCVSDAKHVLQDLVLDPTIFMPPSQLTLLQLYNVDSTKVEHSTAEPEVKGSNLATARQQVRK